MTTPDEKSRTVRTEFSFPSVIRLRRYARIPYKHIVLTRKNIMKRDGKQVPVLRQNFRSDH